MPVSNVKNANSIIKLALMKKGQSVGRKTVLPEYMQMTGSVFKSNGAVVNQPQTLTNLNTKRTLKDLRNDSIFNNRKPQQAPPVVTAAPKKTSDEPKTYDQSVSGGKQAIADNNETKGKVQEQTTAVKSKQKDVQKIASDAAKDDKNTVKDDKKFLSAYKRESDNVKRDNQRLIKIMKETEEHQRVIDDAQNELDGLIAAGNSGVNSSNGNTNNARVKELQQLIGCRVGMCQKNGKSIYSLKRNQTRSLHKMNKNYTSYVKLQKANTKQIQNQQSKTNDVIEFASEVEKWSAVATSGGQALGLLGKVFVAAGSVGGVFGAALITIGTVMQKVGAVVELVGQYGQTAANLTKSVAYAAEGNLMGAMQSTAAAMATGAAAVKGTKELKGTFGKINQEAEAATQKIAAKAAAKDAINEMKNNGTLNLPEGMTEKQARKYMTADLRKQMQDNKNLKGLGYKELTEKAKANSDAALQKAQNAYTTAQEAANKGLNIASGATNIDGRYATNTLKKNGTVKTISQGKLNRTVNKNFKNAIDGIGVNKTNFDFSIIDRLGNSVTNIASVIATNSTMKSMYSGGKKSIPQAHLDARTQRIMKKNQRYRAIRNYAA